jgi:hypothetical protein
MQPGPQRLLAPFYPGPSGKIMAFLLESAALAPAMQAQFR